MQVLIGRLKLLEKIDYYIIATPPPPKKERKKETEPNPRLVAYGTSNDTISYTCYIWSNLLYTKMSTSTTLPGIQWNVWRNKERKRKKARTVIYVDTCKHERNRDLERKKVCYGVRVLEALFDLHGNQSHWFHKFIYLEQLCLIQAFYILSWELQLPCPGSQGLVWKTTKVYPGHCTNSYLSIVYM